MTNDLVRGGFDLPERRRRDGLARPTRAQKEMGRRAEMELVQLALNGQKQEFIAALRRRAMEDALHDVRDVAELARNLAGGDQFLATMLVPLVQEYSREVARDIRYFGRSLGA